MEIYSPIVTGSGAFVLHNNLANKVQNYTIRGIDPKWALITPALGRFSKDCDLIHTAPDMGSAVLTGASRVVLTFHNYYLDRAYLSRVDPLRSLFYRTALRSSVMSAVKKASRLVAVSHATAALVKEDIGLDCDVIENGVDIELFQPAIDKPESDKIRILFSGNPSARKGKDALIAVAEQLPDHCHLVITGGLRDEKHSGKDATRIEWLPRIPYEEMHKLYQQADIMFFPSWREGLSLVLLEAMSCGLPIVTTNISSMPELVDHGMGGYLYTSGDNREALKYLNELADDREKRNAMGKYNRQKILESYTMDKMVSAYQAIFNSC